MSQETIERQARSRIATAKWAEKNKEKVRQYREANKEKMAEYQRQWRKDNPGVANEYSKKSYRSNPDNKEANRIRELERRRAQGIGPVVPLSESDRRIRAILTAAKARAIKKGLEFDLCIEDIVVPEFCPMLGIPINTVSSAGDFNNRDNAASIDRIDSCRGYVKDNIQVISYRANRIKNDSTLEEFGLIYNYWLSHFVSPCDLYPCQ